MLIIYPKEIAPDLVHLPNKKSYLNSQGYTKKLLKQLGIYVDNLSQKGADELKWILNEVEIVYKNKIKLVHPDKTDGSTTEEATNLNVIFNQIKKTLTKLIEKRTPVLPKIKEKELFLVECECGCGNEFYVKSNSKKRYFDRTCKQREKRKRDNSNKPKLNPLDYPFSPCACGCDKWVRNILIHGQVKKYATAQCKRRAKNKRDYNKLKNDEEFKQIKSERFKKWYYTKYKKCHVVG